MQRPPKVGCEIPRAVEPLRAVLERLISDADRPLRAPELCALINQRGLYRRKDGTELQPMQVSATAHQAHSLHVSHGFISLNAGAVSSQGAFAEGHSRLGRPTVVLEGCVSQKASAPAPARDLYRSTLFRGRRAHAEATDVPWFIVSALHGLIEPDQVVAPYDVSIGSLDGAARTALGESVVASLEQRLGSLAGSVIEIHAGDEDATAIERPLRIRGAILSRPLKGLALGKQLQWYKRDTTARQGGSSPSSDAAVVRPRNLALAVTTAFLSAQLDLRDRPDAPAAGWSGMPEIIAAKELRADGATDTAVRYFLTFAAAMDRARDADLLWTRATALWKTAPWVFEPARISSTTLSELRDILAQAGVSQRHGPDSAAWRVIAETLAARTVAPRVLSTIEEGVGHATDLLADLQTDSAGGQPSLPFLRGPKVGPMWVRMLAAPGGARIEGIAAVPVAVDVQVRRITENLGIANTAGMSLDEARPIIQQAWSDDVRSGGAAGVPGIDGTCAALDPALWFYAKWGCSYCERSGRRKPIATACDPCLFQGRTPA